MAIIMGKGCMEAIYGLMGWKGLTSQVQRLVNPNIYSGSEFESSEKRISWITITILLQGPERRNCYIDD